MRMRSLVQGDGTPKPTRILRRPVPTVALGPECAVCGCRSLTVWSEQARMQPEDVFHYLRCAAWYTRRDRFPWMAWDVVG